MKITAAEARELAGRTPQEEVDAVYPLIREAAEQKRRRIALRGDFWSHGGYIPTPAWLDAQKILEADGFDVKFKYEENQLVDMYTLVSW